MKKLNDKGITLVELATGMVITIIITGAALSAFYSTSGLYAQQRNRNEQSIIMDHVAKIIDDQLRYAYKVKVNTSTTMSSGYDNIMSSANNIVKNNAAGTSKTILCDASMMKNHGINVSFSTDSAYPQVVFYEITLDNGDGVKITQKFSCKILNLSMTDGEKVEGTIGSVVHYNNSST